MTTWLKRLAFGLAIAVFVVGCVLVFAPMGDAVGLRPLRVSGRVVDAPTGAPRAGVRVALFPSRARRDRDAAMLEDAIRTRGEDLVDSRYAARPRAAHERNWQPLDFGMTTTDEAGRFTIYVGVWWSWSTMMGSGPTDPPPRRGVECIQLLQAGGEPVWVDVPSGTWSERDGRDPVPHYAAWDIGDLTLAARSPPGARGSSGSGISR